MTTKNTTTEQGVTETPETKPAAKKTTKRTTKKATPKKATKKKTTKAKKTTPKKADKNTTKTAKKSTPAKKTTPAKAAKPTTDKKKSESNGIPRKVAVGKSEWPSKQAAILSVLQKKDAELTKPQIAERIKERFGMSEDKINFYCYALQELELVHVSVYEGDRTHYRSVTGKGKQTKLPTPFAN